jgi:hypothetical protein
MEAAVGRDGFGFEWKECFWLTGGEDCQST